MLIGGVHLHLITDRVQLISRCPPSSGTATRPGSSDNNGICHPAWKLWQQRQLPPGLAAQQWLRPGLATPTTTAAASGIGNAGRNVSCQPPLGHCQQSFGNRNCNCGNRDQAWQRQ
jgi:hypothetical protein